MEDRRYLFYNLNYFFLVSNEVVILFIKIVEYEKRNVLGFNKGRFVVMIKLFIIKMMIFMFKEKVFDSSWVSKFVFLVFVLYWSIRLIFVLIYIFLKIILGKIESWNWFLIGFS